MRRWMVAIGIAWGWVAALWAGTEGCLTFEDDPAFAGGVAVVGWAEPLALAIEVPGTLGGKPVTAIGEGVFQDCVMARSLVLPDSVRTIGKEAFEGCVSLTTLRLPADLRQIGKAAFRSCQRVETVAFPEGLETVGAFAFSNCHALREVALPTSTKALGEGAFELCTHLTRTRLPEGLDALPDSLFRACYRLRDVDLPTRVATLGDEAFAQCHALDGLTLPPTLTQIGSMAFSETGRIFVDPANPAFRAIPDGALLSKDGKTLLHVPRGVEAFAFPEGVEAVDAEAFRGCDALESLTIPATVRRVGAFAFAACARLREVTLLGEGVRIGRSAFSLCTALRVVDLPEGAAMDEGLCFVSHRLTEVRLPGRLTLDPEMAPYDPPFGGLPNLRRAIFKGKPPCASPLWLFGGDAQDALGVYPAAEREAWLPLLDAEGTWEGLPMVEAGQASPTPGTHPDAQPALRDDAFLVNSAGDTVTLRKWVGDRTVRAIAVPATHEDKPVAEIGDAAFSGLPRLASVTLPEGLVRLGRNVFAGSPRVDNLRLPASLIEIGEGTLAGVGRVFADPANPAFRSTPEGALLTKDGKTLLHVPCGVEAFAIPEGVRAIAAKAFAGCRRLTDLTIPAHVRRIESAAFVDCASLARVRFEGEGVRFVGAPIFFMCGALRTLALPKGALIEKDGLVSACPALETLVLAEGIDYHSDHFPLGVFCDNLRRVVFLGPPPDLSPFKAQALGNLLRATGYYPRAHRAAWRAILSPEGTWEGLPMREYDPARLRAQLRR